MTLVMDKNKDKKITAQGWQKYLFFLILSLSLKLLYFSLSPSNKGCDYVDLVECKKLI